MKRITAGGVIGLAIVAALGAWLLLAGQSSRSYQRTAACIDGLPASTGMSGDVDYLAQTAKHAGATDIYGEHVTVLEASPGIGQQYEAFGAGKVEKFGNLLVVWDDPPTAEQDAALRGCVQ